MDLHKAEKHVELLGCEAVLAAENGKISIVWKKSAADAQKKPSAETEKQEAEAIAQIKKLAKDIRSELATWTNKIERYYLQDISWTYEEWLRKYVHHGTLRLIAGRLIWQAEYNGQSSTFVATKDGALGYDNKPFHLPLNARISLWHPLFSDSETINVWRERLLDWKIKQPFSQAWRETYCITEAEENTGKYSNRFAGYVLKQHQMRALAISKGWSPPYKTGFDHADVEPNYIVLPDHGLQAEYWCSAFKEAHLLSHRGSYLFIKTDRLKFHRLDPKAKHKRGNEVALPEVPAIVFSEIMRHCDLFTSISSVTLDPEWQDRGADAKHPSFYDETSLRIYEIEEQSYLSQSMQIRKEILQRLVTSLNWQENISIESHYVRVKGVINNYSVHLGSASVCIEETKKHICIVPDFKKIKVKSFLTFEDDKILSIILSKLQILLNDDALKEKSIKVQIFR